MQVDLEKLTSFGLSGDKDICFTIDNKKVSYRVPYCVYVNKNENKNENKLYMGRDSLNDCIDLSKKDIEAIFSGDETVIELACKNYIASKFKNKYYIGG